MAFDEIRDITDSYPYVSVSCVWPGIVSRPIVYHEYSYHSIKQTVDLVDCIQIGLSFADSSGRRPAYPNAFQFNFTFNHNTDVLLDSVIDSYLSCGFDFTRAETDGVDMADFGEILLNSGLLMNSNIYWITYHGCYELAYLLKALSGSVLPTCLDEFNKCLYDYFVSCYDVKCMLQTVWDDHNAFASGNSPSLREACQSLGLKDLVAYLMNGDMSIRGGLNGVLVSACFFNTLKIHFNNKMDDSIYNGRLFGLEDPPIPHSMPSCNCSPRSSSSGDAGAKEGNGGKNTSSICHNPVLASRTSGLSSPAGSSVTKLAPGMLRIKQRGNGG